MQLAVQGQCYLNLALCLILHIMEIAKLLLQLVREVYHE